MINQNRLYSHIEELGNIGKVRNGGVTRFPYTKEDEAAKAYLIQLMKDAHLDVHVDAVGNIIGKRSGKTKQKLLCGSHIDTVRNGGNFDGCLGVLSAIEAMQSMDEQGMIPGCDIEVIAFKNEEGNRFSTIMTGSHAICGTLTRQDIEAHDDDGITLREAAKAFGYAIDDYTTCAYDFNEIKAYLELHIEQGRILDKKQLSVGIVKGIAGLRRYVVTFFGESGHSGAIPMSDRLDPVTAFASFSTFIDHTIRKYPDAVATIGEIHTYPGSCNVICDHVTCSLDIRSLSMADILSFMNEVEMFLQLWKEKGFDIHIDETQVLAPALCDKHIKKIMSDVITQANLPVYELMSGAGHDAMNFYGHCPIAMLFVRSEHGYSHRPDEYTSKEDCAKACDILLQTMVKLSYENL